MKTAFKVFLLGVSAFVSGCGVAVPALRSGSAADPCAPEAPLTLNSDVLRADVEAPDLHTAAGQMPVGHHMHGMAMEHAQGMKMDGDNK